MKAKKACEMPMHDMNGIPDLAKSDVAIKSETKAKKLQAKAIAEDGMTDFAASFDEKSNVLVNKFEN